jgi:hypothetical protein
MYVPVTAAVHFKLPGIQLRHCIKVVGLHYTYNKEYFMANAKPILITAHYLQTIFAQLAF